MINENIGYILMIIGALFITIGIYGMFKFKNIFTRAAIASLIDTAGFILIATGIIFYKGFSLFSLKIGVIIFFVVLLNPLANHIIVRGAYSSGHDAERHVKKSRQ